MNIWKYALNVIKTEGIVCFLKKVAIFIIGQVVIILYPLCRIMNIKEFSVQYGAIGHLASELDCYVKEGILGLRPSYFSIILVLDRPAERYAPSIKKARESLDLDSGIKLKEALNRTIKWNQICGST